MSSPDRKELKAQWKTEVEVSTFETKDVAKHNTKTDLWVIIHGKVYNVTPYLRDHPGGPEALIEVAGQDATSAYEDVGHSEDAREIMHTYLVGTVKGAPAQTTTKAPASAQIVRRGPAKTESPSGKSTLFENGKLTSRAELAIGCFGGTVLIWACWATGLLPKVMSGLEHRKGQSHSDSFATGALSASALAGTVGYIAYARLAKALEFGGSYTRFPPHVHIANTVISVNRPAGVLKPSEYQQFPLIRKDQLSHDAVRLVFELPHKYDVLGLPIGQHVAIRGYFDDEEGHHTVTRSYTPVSNNKDLGRLELVIKLYPDGQLTGKYMSKLQIGDKVEFRGPKGAMRYRKGMSDHLGMVAGGTGITPMYQIIRAICEDKTDPTTVSLVFANRSVPDILLQTQLERLQKMAPEKFKITYVLDKPPADWTGETGYVTKKMIQEKLPPAEKTTKILLCGPPGLVNAAKKNLVELGFDAPGAVTKLSDQVFCF